MSSSSQSNFYSSSTSSLQSSSASSLPDAPGSGITGSLSEYIRNNSPSYYTNQNGYSNGNLIYYFNDVYTNVADGSLISGNYINIAGIYSTFQTNGSQCYLFHRFDIIPEGFYFKILYTDLSKEYGYSHFGYTNGISNLYISVSYTNKPIPDQVIGGLPSSNLISVDVRIVAATNQDLETAVRMKLGMAIVIFNDQSYNLIKWKSMKKFGTSYGVDFTNPDFIKVAEGFGAVGLRLETAEDFEPMLRDALTKDVPAIIDVPIDYSDNELIYKLL